MMTRLMRERIAGKLQNSRLAQNSLWMMTGQGASLVLQTAYFFVLARLLGSKEYGVFVGAVAFCSIVSQYAANGAGTLYLRYVSSERGEHGRYLGNIFLSALVFGTICLVGLRLAAPHLLNLQSASIIVVVAIGECICKQVTDAVARVFQAHERMKATALLSLVLNALRCGVAASMLLVLHTAGAVQWARASVAVSIVGTLAMCALAVRTFGMPEFAPGLLSRRFSEGVGFSFAGSTFSVYNDIDKTMLSHYGMNAANGLYTMAYRVIDTATMPSWSIYSASLPRLFRAGANGARETWPLARKVLLASLAISLPMAAVLFLVAPLVPMMLGHSFSGSVQAIRWLAILPVLRSFQLSGGGALTGSGHQRYRTAGQLAAAAGNFGLNLYLIPRYGWLGAAWASIATDGLIGALNWVMLLRVSGMERTDVLEVVEQHA